MRQFFLFIDRLNRTARLVLALTIGCLVYFITIRPGQTALSFLYSWICFAGISLFFSWVTILSQHPKQIGRIAREQDENLFTVFLIVVTAAFISLFAVIFLLNSQPTASRIDRNLHIALSLVAIVLSWLLIHSVFTIRYAHHYFDKPGPAQPGEPCAGGLQFPGGELPDFLDFAYFSFILAMTFQTADVNITSRRIRRLALVHGLLSFVYNTTIIALLINIISGVIGR